MFKKSVIQRAVAAMQRGVTAMVLALGMPLAAHAAYPEKPITLIVPFSAGASTDSLGRLVAESVSRQLGQPVVVENRAGAAGTIAADYLKTKAPDGYTIMLTTDGIMAINPAIYRKLNYDPQKDFSPITIVGTMPLVMVVRKESPFQTLQDVVSYAKQHPGELTYGSSGVGTSQHLGGELFKVNTGTDITHVPYKGGANAITDMLGGHISLLFGQSPSASLLERNGKVRILGISSAQRNETLPEVKTFSELGVTGYDFVAWYGFMLPAGADPAIIKTLNRAVTKAINEKVDYMKENGYVIQNSTPEAMADNIRANGKRWADLAKAAGIYQTQ